MTSVIAIENCELLGQRPHDRFRIGILNERVVSVERQSGLPIAHDSANTIDARGRLLLPGFIDAHAHVVEAGIERGRCDMSSASSAAEVLSIVRHYADSHPGGWVVGRGWEWADFDDSILSLRTIDDVTGSRPAYLNNANGHCAWVNSAALSLAGITESSVSPEGGRIGKDSSGRLTGVLFEHAMDLVSALIPPLTDAEKLSALIAAEKELHRFGVVAWQEANVGDFVPTTDVLDTLLSAAESGALRSDVNAALWWPFDEGADYLDEICLQRDRLATSPQLRAASVKIMLDGTASQRTAALLGAYDDGTRGEQFFDTHNLTEIVCAAHSAGFDVHFHANGDRAVQQALDAVEAAHQRDGRGGGRHQLTHLNFVRREDVTRMAQLGVAAVAQPAWGHPSAKLVDTVLPSIVGSESALIYPLASLQRAGVPIAFSSDWPVSLPDPWLAIHTAVNRHNSSSVRSGPLLSMERMSAHDAVEAATAGSAYVLRRERDLGAIEVGKKATFALVDRSWRDAAESLESTRVDATLVNGNVVYEA